MKLTSITIEKLPEMWMVTAHKEDPVTDMPIKETTLFASRPAMITYIEQETTNG